VANKCSLDRPTRTTLDAADGRVTPPQPRRLYFRSVTGICGQNSHLRKSAPASAALAIMGRYGEVSP
jgi:hypothetical protein